MEIRLLRFFLFVETSHSASSQLHIVLMLNKDLTIFLISRTTLSSIVFPETFDQIIGFFMARLVLSSFDFRSKPFVLIVI